MDDSSVAAKSDTQEYLDATTPRPDDAASGQLLETNGRDRWSSRTAFILAAIGSAIGLGNFWRFPYLLYKHGGGVFLIPYIMALFVVGIPLLQLEITIGQLFQKGNAQALARLSPKMMGVGFASAFSAFTIVSYYVMVVAWVVIYFFQSFRSTLPWAGASDCTSADGVVYTNAEYYLYRDVLSIWTKTEGVNGTSVCSFRAQDNSEGIQWETFASMVFVWLCIFLCVFKGAHHTSKVVYVTVILPFVILFVLLIRSVTLEGASLGIDAYIANWDFSKLSSAEIWVDAVSQIFFSLSVSSSVMVSFGSYNKRGKPVLADSFIIAISNSIFSIISGFVVWSTLGFFATKQGLTIDQLAESSSLSSLGLVFITYPLALGEVPGTQVWCVLLFLNLFMLGIDSAFSLVEGYAAVVADTAFGQRFTRPVLLLVVTVPAMLLGLFYCQDTGLYWFDTVDHFVQYIMLLSGAMHCFAIGWANGTLKSSPLVGKASSYLYGLGYTMAVILLVTLTISTASSFRTDEELKSSDGKVSYEFLIGSLVFIATFAGFSFLSMRRTDNTPETWFSHIFLTGPMEFVDRWCRLGAYLDIETNIRVILGQGTQFQDKLMQFYRYFWSFTVKYFIPVSVLMLLFVGIRGDVLNPYSGYIDRYQALGWIIFFIGLAMAAIPMIVLPFEPRYDPSLDTQEDRESVKPMQETSQVANEARIA